MTYKEEGELKSYFLERLNSYHDFILISRLLEIGFQRPPKQIESIVGIDTGGRVYAKLVKTFFDKIKVQNSQPSTKILFLNVHANDSLIKSLIDDEGQEKFMYLETDPSYDRNNLLKNKDFGRTIVIDDWTSGKYRTKHKFFEVAQELKNNFHCQMDVQDYIYFEKTDYSKNYYDPLTDWRNNIFFGGKLYLDKGKQEKQKKQPWGLLATPHHFEELFQKKETRDLINETNKRIDSLSDMAVEIYGKNL